jgi:predicted dehydrogenase
MKRILLVGSGSIATKYLNVLFENYQIDVVTSRKLEGTKFHRTYTKSDSLPNNYDLLIITSKTNDHISDYLNYRSLARKCLIEKPLTYSKELIPLNLKTDHNCWMSAPLRFTEKFESLSTAIISTAKPFQVVATTKSWFPDWRPARKIDDGYWNSNIYGGIIREQLHEIDYLCCLFGFPNFVRCETKKTNNFPKLEISDRAKIVFEYVDGSEIQIYIDISSKDKERYVYVNSKDQSTFYDFLSGTLIQLDNETLTTKELESSKPFKLESLLKMQVEECLGEQIKKKLPDMNFSISLVDLVSLLEKSEGKNARMEFQN